MGTQQLFIIGAVVVLVGGGAWYMTQSSDDAYMSSHSSKETRATDDSTPESLSEKITGSGSLHALMALGKSVKCTFSHTMEGETSSGTFYYDDERFRVDAHMETPEGTAHTNVLNDGTRTYTWGETPQGSMALVFDNKETDTTSFDEAPMKHESREHIDFEQQVSYDCDPWRVDPSVFVPPSDITFNDMEAMMRTALEGMPEGFELPPGL